MQINIEARRASAVPFMGCVTEGTILPILWVEVGIDKIPETVMSVLYHAYYTANAVESFLQWGSLMGFLLSAVALGFLISKHRAKEYNIRYRNTSGQHPLLETM